MHHRHFEVLATKMYDAQDVIAFNIKTGIFKKDQQINVVTLKTRISKLIVAEEHSHMGQSIEPSKICGRQPLKNLKVYGLAKQ